MSLCVCALIKAHKHKAIQTHGLDKSMLVWLLLNGLPAIEASALMTHCIIPATDAKGMLLLA